MAVALESESSASLAGMEKSAIEYIDSFIDGRQKVYGAAYLVPLVSFQGHVGIGPNSIRRYIGQRKKEVEDFITLRPHLWKVRATNAAENAAKMLVVEKQPDDLRAALVRVLAYVQRKTEETGQGAKLNNISVLIGQHHQQIKKILGVGLSGVKSFVLGYSLLFEMVPYDVERTEMGDILFKHRASVVNGVILLPLTTTTQSCPTRMEGVGPVVRLFPAYGFVRDEKSKEDAYFTMQALQGISEDTFRRLAAEGEKFTFEAFISREFETGKTTNKWSVFRMRPRSSLVSSSGASDDGAASSSNRENGSHVNPRRPAMVCSVFSIDMASSDGKTRSDAGSEFSSMWNEKLDETATVPKTSRSVLRKLKSSLENVNTESPIHVPPSAPARLSQAVPGKGKGPCPTGDLPASKDGDVASANKFPTTAGISGTRVSKVLESQQHEKPAETRPKSSRSSRQVAAANAKAVEKCEVGCQTEFNDERELLLRLLRRSSDLLKLVKAVRGANETE